MTSFCPALCEEHSILISQTWLQESAHDIHPATLLQLEDSRAGTADAAEGTQGEQAGRAALTADGQADQGPHSVQAPYHGVYGVGLLLPQLDQEVQGLQAKTGGFVVYILCTQVLFIHLGLTAIALGVFDVSNHLS